MKNKTVSPPPRKAKQPGAQAMSTNAALRLVKQYIVGDPGATDYDAHLALDVVKKALAKREVKHA